VRFDRDAVPGFIDPQSFIRADSLELLTPSGAIARLSYEQVKAICFVRDFDSAPEWKRDRLFVSRPKLEGLWVRFRFRDGDQLDGILPNNLQLLDAQGYMVGPADPTFQNQRIFIPKTAIEEVKVIGVVGATLRGRTKPRKPEGQLEMFDR
jgi:uncharacterized protein DUF6982